MILATSLSEVNSEKVPLLEAEFPHWQHAITNFAEKVMRQGKGGGHIHLPSPCVEVGQLAKKWGGKRNGWVADYLPNPAIIPKPGKVAGMIWIAEPFQTLLMSALIAELTYCENRPFSETPRRTFG
jgi:hypothetical protein